MGGCVGEGRRRGIEMVRLASLALLVAEGRRVGRPAIEAWIVEVLVWR